MQARCQATLTQPLQWVLQHDVANPHASTHMATPDDNNHAAIPMRSASQVQETHRTTHTGTTTRWRIQRRNRLNSKRSKPQPPHTRYLSSPAEATLHGKIQGFMLRLSPQNKAHTHMATPDDNNHAAIPMRSANADSRNAKNYAHRNN